MTKYLPLGIIIVGSALNDFNKTVAFTVAICTIQGVTFLGEKISGSLQKDYSSYIKFAGMCLTAIPAIGLISVFIMGIPETVDSIKKFSNAVGSVGNFIASLFKGIPVK